MSRLTRMRAFTLIELIVVVIIIGILAAIAAVAYNKFVSQARTTAATADAKQVVTALSAYGQQNDVSAADAMEEYRDQVTATVSGNVSLGPVEVNFKTTPATVTMYVAVGSGMTTTTQVHAAAHSCVLDLTGELPVLKQNTCK